MGRLWERLRRHSVGQAALFTAIGAATTLGNAVLYVLLRGTFDAEVSNVLSVLITTIASTTAHRLWVFRDRREHPLRMHLQTAATFLYYCTSNHIALWLLTLITTNPTTRTEAAAVIAMSLLGGTTRFLALRLWVFTRTPNPPTGETQPPKPTNTHTPQPTRIPK